MMKTLRTVVAMLIGACLTACTDEPTVEGEMNAVYYWRTELRLDSVERQFLADQHISRIYCRYFDVVQNEAYGPVPNATISLADTMPEGVEVVPTVFIVEQCMHQPADSLATRLVERIVQMNKTHDIGNVHELQIDCDYTARSRQNYYQFLEAVRRCAAGHGLRLSATIRLHQLSMPPPPVDEGVLMLYNTGSLERSAERNPILDVRDVLPYVPRLKAYRLPLCAAYPVFLWQRRVHGVSIEHVADISEVARVKQKVEAERDDLRRRIITYDLSEENINRYKPDDYETIYHH